MSAFLGQAAIVTGAAGGIGAATVRRLASEGVHVVAIDLDRDAVAALVDELATPALALDGDVSDPTLGTRAVELALATFGRLDILVNNAGAGSDQVPVWEIELDTWIRDLTVNLTSQFMMSKSVIPTMIDAGYGRIVNVASAAGMEGHALAGGYAAAKAGVIAMTKTLGKELAKSGVIVNCIAPALIGSGMLDQPWFTEDVKQLLLSRIPMGRIGEPEEVAEMIAFLASDKVTFSTGAVFDLSGGRATY